MIRRIRRIGLIGFGLVLLASSAFAGSFTFTTTATQDAALQWVVNAWNAEISKQNAIQASNHPPGPALPLETVQSYLQSRIGQVLDSYASQLKTVTDAQLKQAAEAAPDAIKTQVKNLLTCGNVVCP